MNRLKLKTLETSPIILEELREYTSFLLQEEEDVNM